MRELRQSRKFPLQGTADGKRPEERLTGKQRILRGLKYFLGVFTVVFVEVTLHAALAPERNIWSFAAACAAATAGLAGLMVMAFPRRHLWHGVFAVVTAMVACGLYLGTCCGIVAGVFIVVCAFAWLAWFS